MQIDRPWLKFYGQGVPHDVEPPALTLPELLPAAAGHYPERTALIMAVAGATYYF